MHTPPVQLDENACRLALGDPETPGIVLLTILMWAFGEQVLGNVHADIEPMDPAELWAATNERFGTWIPEEGENKVNALVLAIQTDLFYRDTETFTAIASALFSGDLGDLVNSGYEDLSALEVMWAMLEVELAREDEAGEELTFSDSVQALIEKNLAEEQEDQQVNEQTLHDAFLDLCDAMRRIGVPSSALRLWDSDYAELMDQVDTMTVQ